MATVADPRGEIEVKGPVFAPAFSRYIKRSEHCLNRGRDAHY
jgi:hypothetical protein